jgi:uncharacterized protein involved in exopolysaccharide biosynthesis
VIPGTKYSPEQIVATILRHRWLLISGLVVGCALATLTASMLPKSYKSDAVILVVPQRVPDGYIKPIVGAKIEDRVKTISQEILGQTWLQRIINEYDLYPELRRANRLEEAVNRMRNRDIKIGFVKGDAFQVSYSSHDPLVAHKVTARLASDFVTENMRDRGDVADATVGLLEAELSEKKQQLEQSEQKLEEYRRRHAGELPTQQGANQQILQNLQMQVQSVLDAINRDRDRRPAGGAQRRRRRAARRAGGRGSRARRGGPPAGRGGDRAAGAADPLQGHTPRRGRGPSSPQGAAEQGCGDTAACDEPAGRLAGTGYRGCPGAAGARAPAAERD